MRTVESQEKAYLKILDKLKKDREEKFDQPQTNNESPLSDNLRPTDAALEKLAAEEELKETVPPDEVIMVTVESRPEVYAKILAFLRKEAKVRADKEEDVRRIIKPKLYLKVHEVVKLTK